MNPPAAVPHLTRADTYRVFRDIGHIFFIAIPVHLRFRFLVAWPCPEDLLLCAKHLFVAAMMAWVHPRAARNKSCAEGRRLKSRFANERRINQR